MSYTKTTRFVAAFLSVMISASAQVAKDTRIINGVDAQNGRYPYSVSLQTPNSFHFCGGSLIGTCCF
jgi:secreted trypsin-like serine protease